MRATSVLVVSVIVVSLLVGAVAVPFSTPAEGAEYTTKNITHYECSGIWETYIAFQQKVSLAPNEDPCKRTAEVKISDPSGSDQAWNTVDIVRDTTAQDKKIFSNVNDGLAQLLTVEGFAAYRNSIIQDGDTELEARTDAENAIYEQGNNAAKQIIEKNDRMVLEASRALEVTPASYVYSASTNPGPTQTCGWLPGQSSQTVNVNTSNRPDGLPSSDSFTNDSANFYYIDYSGSLTYVDHYSNTGYDSCQEVMNTCLPTACKTTFNPSGEWSPLGSERTSPHSGGDNLAHGGVSGIGSKDTISVASSTFEVEYEELGPLVSDAVSEVASFQQSTTAAEIRDGEVVQSPSELARQAANGSDAFGAQLLALSNETALPDTYGGNLSDVRVGPGFEGAAGGFTSNGTIFAPTPRLRDAINGSISEGETINFNKTAGGAYLINPESGQREFIDTGNLTLRDSPNPSGESRFTEIDISGQDPLKTLEQFRLLSNATENASLIVSGTGSGGALAGLLSGDGNGPLGVNWLVWIVAALLIAVFAALMLSDNSTVVTRQ